MTDVKTDIERHQVSVPIAGGEISLHLPAEISERTLMKEIASQDLVRKRLLGFVEQLDSLIDSNRELLVCPVQKLHGITNQFIALCCDLRGYLDGFGKHTSAIPELEEARGDVRTFFYGQIDAEVVRLEDLKNDVFEEVLGELRPDRNQLKKFRKKLAKTAGMVRTELQKYFAHLFANDPRNLFREKPKGQQEILFLQFRQDVEITAQLYAAVRRLDRYMRGAIVPSDLLQMTADRVERERSIACLFEQDYAFFLNDLIEEIIERLLPELEGILDLDGIWYDDFESIEGKGKALHEVCLMFKVLYSERSGLREKVRSRKMIYKKMEQRCRDQIWAILDVFDTFRYREVADGIRAIDQTLVDLESTLLQWERGIAKRAFAHEDWRNAEPLPRRGERAVVYKL